jgi:hypothetical protein
MPNPDGDGKGGPTSNVALGAELASPVLESSAHSEGSEHGIIIVSGHDAVTGATSSFWDQAASATHGDTAASTLQNTALGTAVGVDHVSPATETTHDFSTALDGSAHSDALESTVVHDAGFASASFGHSELGSATLHDLTSLGSGTFATHMHL